MRLHQAGLRIVDIPRRPTQRVGLKAEIAEIVMGEPDAMSERIDQFDEMAKRVAAQGGPAAPRVGECRQPALAVMREGPGVTQGGGLLDQQAP